MILGDQAAARGGQGPSHRHLTIDEIFRRVALNNPDKPALIDPPNRTAFTEGPPRHLTYAQAERVMAAIAGRLRRMGIPTDSVIGIQLPNTVEHIVTLLGVVRAGMIPALLPLLWRRADAIAALARIGSKALITCGRVASVNPCLFAMRISSEVFSIRHVCAFGQDVPDGVVPLDDLFSAEVIEEVPSLDPERQNNAAAHTALITFDVSENGIVPVARNHLQVLAGGLCATLESRISPDARILSTIAPSSFAGVSLTLMPWLLSSGTLSLHHPFDFQLLAQQVQDDGCRTLILPGPVALRLAAAGALASDGAIAKSNVVTSNIAKAIIAKTIIAAWRSPEQLPVSATWREREVLLLDVPIFGEAGFIAVRRGPSGRPVPIPFGPIVVPHGAPDGMLVAELVRTAAGTLALRGPMVPRHAFPAGIECSGLPHFRIDSSGLVDTGYACRIDPTSQGMVVTAAPAGIVSIGAYRFSLPALREAVTRIEAGATLEALPDPIIGQRLIGNSANRDVMRAALNAVGANPLVTAAFNDRSVRATA